MPPCPCRPRRRPHRLLWRVQHRAAPRHWRQEAGAAVLPSFMPVQLCLAPLPRGSPHAAPRLPAGAPPPLPCGCVAMRSPRSVGLLPRPRLPAPRWAPLARRTPTSSSIASHRSWAREVRRAAGRGRLRAGGGSGRINCGAGAACTPPARLLQHLCCMLQHRRQLWTCARCHTLAQQIRNRAATDIPLKNRTCTRTAWGARVTPSSITSRTAALSSSASGLGLPSAQGRQPAAVP